ncbi:MAG: hypothetical protein Ta2E_00620 [Mycoplasmoidaceae bacterium]|nr:MAG: hypothetical protein Ta2E_00620 [Mycoplasmoidaceae bacterium]
MNFLLYLFYIAEAVVNIEADDILMQMIFTNSPNSLFMCFKC